MDDNLINRLRNGDTATFSYSRLQKKASAFR